MNKDTQAAGAATLHAAIMNIPCHPYRDGEEFVIGYKFGHRDARHAAAELALASTATAPSAPASAAPSSVSAERAECDHPPVGWRCTRAAGHEGPCAAIPDDRTVSDQPPHFARGYATGYADGMKDAALTPPAPAAAPQAREEGFDKYWVAREDFDKMSSDLTRAKNPLVRLWDKHPEGRAQIEGATGSWFVWGQDRDATPSPAVSAEPVALLQLREALDCLNSVMRAASHVLVGLPPSEKEAKLRDVLSKAHDWYMAERTAQARQAGGND